MPANEVLNILSAQKLCNFAKLLSSYVLEDFFCVFKTYIDVFKTYIDVFKTYNGFFKTYIDVFKTYNAIFKTYNAIFKTYNAIFKTYNSVFKTYIDIFKTFFSISTTQKPVLTRKPDYPFHGNNTTFYCSKQMKRASKTKFFYCAQTLTISSSIRLAGAPLPLSHGAARRLHYTSSGQFSPGFR